MGLLSRLETYFRHTGDQPPLVAPAAAPIGLEQPDSIELLIMVEQMEVDTGTPEPEFRPRQARRAKAEQPRYQQIGEDLAGISMSIDYVDAKGMATRRRIRLQSMAHDGAGRVHVFAHCHERSANRHFLFERICSVIDIDGEIHEPAAYFTNELRIDLAAPAADLEVVPIVSYIEARAAIEGIVTSDEDRAALAAYVRRQYPTTTVLRACLDDIAAENADAMVLWLDYAERVVQADGQEHAGEISFLREVHAATMGARTTVASN